MTETQRKSAISVDSFNAWTSNNFYRTSYASHYTNKPEPPKSVAMPGYAGFIPYVKANNIYGKGYSPITRIAFNNPELGQNKFKLSSTGFNLDSSVHIDPSRSASSHKYGAQTIHRPHPCVGVDGWKTQYQDNFHHPKSLVPPTYRTTDKYLQTEKNFTKQSGFQQNHTTFDGTGWVPDDILHSDQKRTEYRIQFNQNRDYHRNPAVLKLRRLQKMEMNYKHT